jgi:hypothetical protein
MTLMTRICNPIHIKCWLAPWVALLSIAGVARTAQACDQTQHLCVAYQVDLDDDDPETGWGGSISLGPKAPARGVRITIIRPPPEPPLGLYLDDEGCVDFPTQFAAGHKVLVHPSAILGPSKNIRISMFDWTMVPGVNDNGLPFFSIAENNVEPTASDVCLVGPVADGADIHCDVPTSDVVNLMAIATHTIHRLTSLAGNVLTDADELRIVRVPSVPDYGHYDPLNRWLVTGAGLDRRKYIFAHEIGHWLQSRAQVAAGTEAAWNVNYGYPTSNEDVTAPEPSCQFAVDYEAPLLNPNVEASLNAGLELHGIRSAEYGNAAMTEGFAHLVAAVAFNDITSESGEFVYYKDIDVGSVPAYADLDDGDGLVALPGTSSAQTPGGWNGWVKNSCVDDWNVLYLDLAEQNRVEISTEIDWLRYFWAFVTSQDVALAPQPGFWDLVRLIAHTREHNAWGTVTNPVPANREGRVWENLVQTLTDDPEGVGLDDFLDRFETLNDTHWVWHDPTL